MLKKADISRSRDKGSGTGTMKKGCRFIWHPFFVGKSGWKSAGRWRSIAINEIAIKGIRVYDKQRTVLINKVFI